MNKKSVLVLLLGVLWVGQVESRIYVNDEFGDPNILIISSQFATGEQDTPKIDPPDWYKAGIIAALQDKNSINHIEDKFLFFKASEEWLPFYLPTTQRSILIDKTAKLLINNKNTQAINVLLGLQAKEVIPQLIEVFKDTGNYNAKTVLIGLHAKELITLLMERLTDKHDYSVIKDLAQLQATDAVPQIIQSLNDNDSSVRQTAIEALGKLQATDAVPKITLFLKDSNLSVRQTAIEALGKLQATDAVPQIIQSLNDKNSSVRQAAIKALGELHAKEAIPQIIQSLNDNDSSVRQTAIKALGELQTKEAIPQIIQSLIDNDSSVRQTAIWTLGELQAKESVPQIIQTLNDNDSSVHQTAIKALGELHAEEAIIQSLNDNDSSVRQTAIKALGELQAKEAVPKITQFLTDNNSDVRQTTIWTLGELQAKESVPQIIQTLNDNDSSVRQTAIKALGELHAEEAIIQSLNDNDSSVRQTAIETLGELQAKEAVPKITQFLTDNNRSVRQTAIWTLGELQAKEAAPQIIDFLNDNDPYLHRLAIEALGKLQANEAIPKFIEFLTSPIDSLGDDNNQEIVIEAVIALGELQVEEKELPAQSVLIGIHNLLAVLYDNMQKTRTNRFIAHLLAGNRFQVLVWCLGNNDEQDCTKQVFQDHQTAIDSLKLFTRFYKAIPKDKFSPKLRKDLIFKINMLAEVLVEQQSEQTFAKLRHELSASQDLSSTFRVLADVFAAQEEVTLLDDISKLIEKDGYDTKDLDRKKADILAKQQWLQSVIAASSVFSLHLGFWLSLILLYPHSRMIQAIFFWNPWIRRIIGLGYIGFCLTWIPFLRRRLLSPFKDSLLADANLAAFKPELYFANMSITLKGLNQQQPLLATLAKFRGQIILESESGLGKTMYLRYLAQRSTRPFAFLHATRCNAGVIPALKEKLHGFARNETFLTSIIYAGGVDLCIDGLNEVSPDTRAKITQFVEQHFKGTILLSTQPLEWQPPQTAKTYRLLPLNREQIEAFLLSRPEQPDHYRQTCTEYLNSALSPQLDHVLYELHLKILSNPMDLTIVGHLLAQNIQPNLSNLIEQQYQTMNGEYQRKAFNQNFPLKKFAQHVFDIRLQDKRVLNHVDFGKELDCLAEHKLVIKRTEKQAETEQENYYFRHDKIWDFFNAYVFQQQDNEWRKAYFADERFRGAFLALAWSLPLNDAQGLLAELQHYIVQTNDNILHHQYYQLLDLRNRLLHSGV